MKVLEGIRIVDVTMWAFVPSAGGVLANWGADVIKVENPSAPDPIRLQFGGSLEPGGANDLFKHYSRGKRSIALDLAREEGRTILYQMVERADVFLTSYLTDTRRRLKIDVDDLRAINPRLIYARGTGQGPKGPESERRGYDGITWWCRGTLASSTMRVTGATWPTGMIGHGDGMSGMTLAGGICAALLQRERTGYAPIVDASLMGTAIWFNGPAIIAAQSDRPSPFGSDDEPVRGAPPASRRNGHALQMMAYQTSDWRYLQILFLGDADEDWQDLCTHLGRPDLAADSRFATSNGRTSNSSALIDVLDEIFATKTLAEWRRVLVTARGAWAPVQSPREVYEDPQTLANSFMRYVDYPGGGLKLPVPPVLFDEESEDPTRAPEFSEHTDEILRELGLDQADIAGLREKRVVA